MRSTEENTLPLPGLDKETTNYSDRFATWHMRTSYLSNVKDGVGERLININSSILNTAGFRAAGWTANPADSRPTYSPPIPTTSRSDYFQGLAATGLDRITSWPEEEEEGGVVTGRRSNDTIGPAPATKRRRRREQMEEEDSSDLSDESEDEAESAQRAAQQIKFTRMPVRNRADSSPIRTSNPKEGPELLITSPSRRSADSRFRRGSLGAVDAVKARARRDTTTSSEMSSENEGLNPSLFARRRLNSRTTSAGNLPNDKVNGDPDGEVGTAAAAHHDNSDAESVESTLSSEFGETLHSGSLLDTVDVSGLDDSSPVLSALTPPDDSSPKKVKVEPSSVIQDFPPPRPISVVAPVSLLGSAIRARKTKPVNPIETFATLAGKGSANPLWIKIYAPFSDHPETPYEMPLDRTSKDGAHTTVVEAIGLSLWRYTEQRLTPALEGDQLNVNKWTLRMIEDGEIDYDFPALSRTRPITDFTSNNNRGARGRSRERSFDEFALVEATGKQFEENRKLTPKYTTSTTTTTANEEAPALAEAGNFVAQSAVPRNSAPAQRPNPVLGHPFAFALHNTSWRPADMPEPQTSYATPRMGVIKTLRIRHLDLDVTNQATTMDIATDSYIAEILDHVCKLWDLDKAAYTLKVSGTNTVALLDRTVEALGNRSDLDLVRRRFGTAPLNLTGSPGSESPNAPLLIDIDGPKKGRKGLPMMHPLAQKQDLISSATNFKKYNVTRKHLTAFAQGSHKKILALDADYMHIMPIDTDKTINSSNKTTSIPFADITNTKVSTRHPKVFRVIIRRANESKRYDFEVKDAAEAAEIVDEIKKVMVPQ
jgi:target of rapamycin complex 2 subunit MAPKAP1